MSAYPPILYISTLLGLADCFELVFLEERSSEYLSERFFQTFEIISVISSSLRPDLIGVFKSVPNCVNKQVANFPSGDNLNLVQSLQNGCVIEEIIPISLPLSLYRYRDATSPV